MATYQESTYEVIYARTGEVLGTVTAKGWSAAMRKARNAFPNIRPQEIGLNLIDGDNS